MKLENCLMVNRMGGFLRKLVGRRNTLEWLTLVLWVEIEALLVFRAWVSEKQMLTETTTLLAAAPSGEWWVMMSNIGIIVLGSGVALWWFRHYGVLIGLAIFVLALVALEG